MEEKKEQLQKYGELDTKVLGPEILKAADQEYKERLQKAVVAQVSVMRAKIAANNQQAAKLAEDTRLMQARLEAIDKGEFTVNLGHQYGEPIATIVFHDEKLRFLPGATA